jgi:hypothetical protein
MADSVPGRLYRLVKFNHKSVSVPKTAACTKATGSPKGPGFPAAQLSATDVSSRIASATTRAWSRSVTMV